MRDLRFWRWRKAEDDDLDRELHAHLELATEDRLDAGLPLREAQLAAHREFGSVALIKEQLTDMRTGAALERVWQETRYAMRRLLRSPAFTLATVLTLALALGANASIFAVVYRVVLNPLPYDKSERLVALEFSLPVRNVPKVYYVPLAPLFSVSGPCAHSRRIGPLPAHQRVDVDRARKSGTNPRLSHHIVARLGIASGAGSRPLVQRTPSGARCITGCRPLPRVLGAPVRAGSEHHRTASHVGRSSDRHRRGDGRSLPLVL